MTVLKSNLCPTCGGLLNIDLDKQTYVCPFCGVTFDYEYFREDNVKEVASKSIRRNEYGSAKDAYDFMLAKDPHDFEALRGLFICKNKWQSMNIMKRDNDVHVSADDPILQNAIDNCLPRHRPYFEKVREALRELRHYRDLVHESRDISKKRSTEQTALANLKAEYYYNSRRFTDLCGHVWEMDEKSREAVISYTIIIPLLILALLIYNKAWEILIILAVITGLIIAVYHITKAVSANSIRARMVPYEQNIQKLSEQYDAKQAEAKESRMKYKTLVDEFMEMDPVPQKAETKSPGANHHISPSQT